MRAPQHRDATHDGRARSQSVQVCEDLGDEGGRQLESGFAPHIELLPEVSSTNTKLVI